MKRCLRSLFCITFLAVISVLAAIAADETGNIIVGGDFRGGFPEGFQSVNPGLAPVVETEASNEFLRVHAPNPGPIAIGSKIPIDPAWINVRVSVRMRAPVIEPGEEKWMGGRFAMEWRDADGNRIGNWPKSPCLREPETDWRVFEFDEVVPPGTAYLWLQMGIWGSVGTVDFDDVVITPF